MANLLFGHLLCIGPEPAGSVVLPDYKPFFICLPPEFLPVSGPSEQWCASTLGAALFNGLKFGKILVTTPNHIDNTS